MAMHVDHSSVGSGAFHFPDLEPPEPDFAPPVAPAPTVPAPTPAPTPAPAAAPSNWVAELPPTVFGPPSPHPGQTPAATVLASLAPPPAVAFIETPAVVPVVAAAVPLAAAAATAPTASAMEIATLELTLADPLNQELIHHHGGALPVLDLANLNPVLQEQVDRYGASLTARLMQLAQANAAVRDLYVQAMDEAAQSLGPETMGAVFVPGIAGKRGDSVPDSWRFDPVAFTQAYAQAGQLDGAPLAQRAFVATYGTDALQPWERHHGGDAEFTERGFTLAGSFELNAPTLTDLDGHPNRERMGWTGASLNADSHGLRPLSLQAPPELHNAQAVWFDPTLGWVTPSENVVVKQDFLDKALPVVFIGVMTWATAGAFGVAGGAGVTAGTGIGAGTGVLSAMTAGAAFGAIGSVYGGLIGEGRIDLGSIFRGALTGAITAGVVRASGLDSMGIKTGTDTQGQPIVTSIDYAQRALAVTGQATLQGALQQISGGDFVDGFTAGLAQGLGAEVARGLQLQIDTLSLAGSIDATQAGALRQFARVAQSAVGMLGNPNDPGHAFAMTFVNGLVGDVQQGLTAHETQAASPAWASAPDETAAEMARLARQAEGLAAGNGAQGLPTGPMLGFVHGFGQGLEDAASNPGQAQPSSAASGDSSSGRWDKEPTDYSLASASGQVRFGTSGFEAQPTPEELQANFRASEREYRDLTEDSVAGASYRARDGDSISRIVGSSSPQAIGNFMRANNLTSDRIEVGRSYFVPDDVTAYGDWTAVGQFALNQGNERTAAARPASLIAADGMRIGPTIERAQATGSYPGGGATNLAADSVYPEMRTPAFSARQTAADWVSSVVGTNRAGNVITGAFDAWLAAPEALSNLPDTIAAIPSGVVRLANGTVSVATQLWNDPVGTVGNTIATGIDDLRLGFNRIVNGNGLAMGSALYALGTAAAPLGQADAFSGWPGTGGVGPVAGTIGITDSTSTAALRNYFPRAGGVEFVFDPVANQFVAGSPLRGLFDGSPHEQLAQSIGARNNPALVGGTFQRGPNGEFFTTENSGHYGHNWSDEVRAQFQQWLSGRVNTPVVHETWRP